MKTTYALALLLFGPLLLELPIKAQTPLLEYRFNETGTAAPSSGSVPAGLTLTDASGVPADLHSADMRGVSGLPGDRSFDNTASTGMGGAGVGGGGHQAGDLLAIDVFSSFTLQGWFYASSVMNNAARLFDNGSSTAGWLLWGNNGTLGLYVDGVVLYPGNNLYNQTSEWIFFAVTYDGTLTSDNLKFYRGTKTTPVIQIGSTLSMTVGSVNDSAVPLSVGNTSVANGSIRPFDGYLDNMRVFGADFGSSGVLNPSQLETLRLNDLQNVPEPTASLILIFGCVLLSRLSRSQSAVRQRLSNCPRRGLPRAW